MLLKARVDLVTFWQSLQVGFCCPNVVIQEQSRGLHYHQGFAGLPAGDIHDYLADPQPLTTVDGAFALMEGVGLTGGRDRRRPLRQR